MISIIIYLNLKKKLKKNSIKCMYIIKKIISYYCYNLRGHFVEKKTKKEKSFCLLYLSYKLCYLFPFPFRLNRLIPI